MEIEELRIRAVRGVRGEICIPLRGKSLLIQGENGSGKSSIVLALQWALRGEGEPSPRAQLGSEEGYRRHVLEDPKAPMVAVSLGKAGLIEVSPGSVHCDERGQSFRDACMASNPFLRRSQVLNVLEDRPIDRFRYLEGFLDLTDADRIREVIASRASDYQAESERLTARVQSLAERLALALPSQYKPATTTWETGRSALLGFAANLQLTTSASKGSVLAAAAARAEELSSGDELTARRVALSVLDGDFGSLSERIPKLQEVEALQRRRTELRSEGSTTGLLDLLEHARAHFEAQRSTRSCPVCGQSVEAETVLASLRAKLGALSQLRQVESSLKAAMPAVQGWMTDFTRLAQKARTALNVSSFAELPGVPSRPAGLEQLVRAETPAACDDALGAIGAENLDGWLRPVVRTIRGALAAELARLPPPGSAGDLKTFAVAARVALEHESEVARSQLRLKEIRALELRFSAVAQALRKARQDTAQKLLDQIANTVATYYRIVHPRESKHEVTDAPLIEIRRQREGTAYIRGSFGGARVEDPRWVYSDGHLDTVGICIFLALRRFHADQGGDARVLVLDDIILSIDLGHARNLVGLLRDHFGDHQIILLTHNALFAHWCVDLAPGFRHLVIKRWTLEGGPQFGDYQPALDRLTRTMEGTSEKAIGLELMGLLDQWLFDARFEWALSIPAKRGEQYTLTELWEPFVKAVKTVEKTLHVKVKNASELLDQLRDLPKVRNALPAHENEFAWEYPLSVIRGIAEKVIELMGVLYCFSCHTCVAPLPNRHNPLSLQCRCAKHRYVSQPAPGT